MYRVFAILLLVSVFHFASFAAHIVGGDMYYDCLGNDDYRITLIIYRDCSVQGQNVAWFDEPAYIGIYDASGTLFSTEDVYLTPNSPIDIPTETQDPCLQAPPNVCV